MFMVITGGSGSGKSEYAEGVSTSFESEVCYYIATMQPWGIEGRQRVKRHQRMRSGKGFFTIECFDSLGEVDLKKESTNVVLVECVSNLVANLMFSKGMEKQRVLVEVLEGITHLKSQCNHLIVVTNEVFSDGMDYDEETKNYQQILGVVNQNLAKLADQVMEIVYGIPLQLK